MWCVIARVKGRRHYDTTLATAATTVGIPFMFRVLRECGSILTFTHSMANWRSGLTILFGRTAGTSFPPIRKKYIERANKCTVREAFRIGCDLHLPIDRRYPDMDGPCPICA